MLFASSERPLLCISCQYLTVVAGYMKLEPESGANDT